MYIIAIVVEHCKIYMAKITINTSAGDWFVGVLARWSRTIEELAWGLEWAAFIKAAQHAPGSVRLPHKIRWKLICSQNSPSFSLYIIIRNSAHLYGDYVEQCAKNLNAFIVHRANLLVLQLTIPLPCVLLPQFMVHQYLAFELKQRELLCMYFHCMTMYQSNMHHGHTENLNT